MFCKYGVSKVQNLVTVLKYYRPIGEILEVFTPKNAPILSEDKSESNRPCDRILLCLHKWWLRSQVGRTAKDLTKMVKSRKMTYRKWPNPGRWLTENGQIPEDEIPRIAKSRKMTSREWPNPGRWLPENGQIPEDDLPRMAKSRMMTYREWPNTGRWLPENGQIPDDDLPRMAKYRKMTYREWPNPGRWLTEWPNPG